MFVLFFISSVEIWQRGNGDGYGGCGNNKKEASLSVSSELEFTCSEWKGRQRS